MVRTSVPFSSIWDSESVSKRMRCDGFGNTAAAVGLLTRFFHGVSGDGHVGTLARKQPVLGSCRAPPLAQDLQQSNRKHDIPVLPPLALLDTNDHTLAVDIDRLQVDRFRYPRPRRVADRQNGAVLDVLHALQKLENFLGTENDR